CNQRLQKAGRHRQNGGVGSYQIAPARKAVIRPGRGRSSPISLKSRLAMTRRHRRADDSGARCLRLDGSSRSITDFDTKSEPMGAEIGIAEKAARIEGASRLREVGDIARHELRIDAAIDLVARTRDARHVQKVVADVKAHALRHVEVELDAD